MVGVLGCMAERLKDRMLDRGMVDVVAGPDSYRDLPRLLAIVQARRAAMPYAPLKRLACHACMIPSGHWRAGKQAPYGCARGPAAADSACPGGRARTTSRGRAP